MECNKYNTKECKGGKWCGICSEYVYENDPEYRHEMSEKEIFAMKCQQEFFKRGKEYCKAGNSDKSMSYYSCIQIMEKYLH